MDGKGAWRDNVFVERLWRSIKYEEVNLRAYDTVSEARASIGRYLTFYNGGDSTPALTGRRRTRPTSIGCPNPWQPEPGRAPLIAAHAAVQTNRATSLSGYGQRTSRKWSTSTGYPRLGRSDTPNSSLIILRPSACSTCMA